MARILYVEDHPIFGEGVIERFLAGHDVDWVMSVREAKTCCVNNTYDVVLCDYDLSDGTGDTFVRWLRQRRQALPVIACSSHDRGNEALMEAGATITCGKMDVTSLPEVIAQALDDTQ